MISKRLYSSTDILTLIAISIVAYTLVIIGHELIGHGGVCLLVGGELRGITSTDLYCTFTNPVEWKYKLMVAGGALVNFLSVVLSIILIRNKKCNLHTVYFLWVFMNLNLFLASSYLIASPLLGFGDWNSLVSTLPFPLLWRILLSLIGVGLSLWGIRISLHVLVRKFNLAENDSEKWIKILSRVPPFTVGIIAIIMGLVSPLDVKWSMSLALASFLALLWMVNLHAWGHPPNNEEAHSIIALNRNVFWLVSGTVALIFLIVVLAPGIGSFDGYN